MRTNGQFLKQRLDAALEVGEVPYQANRAAVKEMDVLGNAEAGLAQAQATLSGIDGFVSLLEDFRDGAENVARRAAAVR